MPKFVDHIEHSQSNLDFLSFLTHNTNEDEYLDWKVTTCFYVAVHIMNAHLANFSLQFRTHVDVDRHINPFTHVNIAKVSENVYVAYQQLSILSRRSRYLVNQKNLDSSSAAFCKGAHFAKAINKLEILLEFSKEKLNHEFNLLILKTKELKQGQLRNIKINA